MHLTLSLITNYECVATSIMFLQFFFLQQNKHEIVITSFLCIYNCDTIYSLSIRRMSSDEKHACIRWQPQLTKDVLCSKMSSVKLFITLIITLATVSHFRFFKIQGVFGVKP